MGEESASDVDEHAPTPPMKFDEDMIPAHHTHVPTTRRRIAPPPLRFLASSRPFYYILQHLYISIPLPKYPPSLHSQRAHRFADTRPFVTLLYLDARIRSRTAFAAFDSFYSTFTSHLCSRTGSPFYSTCLHTFYIQIMTHKLAIKTQ